MEGNLEAQGGGDLSRTQLVQSSGLPPLSWAPLSLSCLCQHPAGVRRCSLLSSMQKKKVAIGQVSESRPGQWHHLARGDGPRLGLCSALTESMRTGLLLSLLFRFLDGIKCLAIGQDYFCTEQDCYHLIGNNYSMQIEFNSSGWK